MFTASQTHTREGGSEGELDADQCSESFVIVQIIDTAVWPQSLCSRLYCYACDKWPTKAYGR